VKFLFFLKTLKYKYCKSITLLRGFSVLIVCCGVVNQTLEAVFGQLMLDQGSFPPSRLIGPDFEDSLLDEFLLLLFAVLTYFKQGTSLGKTPVVLVQLGLDILL